MSQDETRGAGGGGWACFVPSSGGWVWQGVKTRSAPPQSFTRSTLKEGIKKLLAPYPRHTNMAWLLSLTYHARIIYGMWDMTMERIMVGHQAKERKRALMVRKSVKEIWCPWHAKACNQHRQCYYDKYKQNLFISSHCCDWATSEANQKLTAPLFLAVLRARARAR